MKAAFIVGLLCWLTVSALAAAKCNPPVAPAALTAVVVRDLEPHLDLFWTDNARTEQSYLVQGSFWIWVDWHWGRWTDLATLRRNATAWTDYDHFGWPVRYRVLAVNKGGAAASNEVELPFDWSGL